MHNRPAIVSALIYTRVSSEEQGNEGRSLPAQLAHCRTYAANFGFMIGGEFTDIMSGKRDDRPQYRAMLAEARRLAAAGSPPVIVVAWLHRLGRRVSERVRAWEECKLLGVEIHSALEGGLQSEVVFNILASIAQEEARQIGERVSATWQNITGQGWHRTTIPPFGYLWRPASDEERASGSPRSVLDIDPRAAPYVAELFARVGAGESTRTVAASLSRLPIEVRTMAPSPVFQQDRLGRGGDAQPDSVYELTRRTVQDMLRNPVYAGRQTRRRGETPGTSSDPALSARPKANWPAIVSDEVWESVQARLNERKRAKNVGRYLLTGFLRCPACSGAMHGETLPEAVASPRYRCGGDDRAHCHQTATRDAVEQAVLAQAGAVLEAISHDHNVQAALKRVWQVERKSKAPDQNAQLRTRLEAEIKQAHADVVSATRKFARDEISKPAYDAMCAQAQAEAASAETELEALTILGGSPQARELPALNDVLRSAGGWSDALRGSQVAEQRDVLSVLVERVVPRRVTRGKYAVEITWSALGARLAEATAQPQAG